jgi:PTH1 family peptidyl-tRNA hydrolase
MKAIVGLGNPGPQYHRTPHNLGFAVVDRLAQRARVRPRPVESLQASMAQGRLAGQDIVLLKPSTYMNLSGEAVATLARDKGLDPPDIFVVADDADLPLGALRWRAKGGDGGHKGLRSILHELGSGSFARLRVGICPARKPEDLEAYVLRPFDAPHWRWAERIVETAARSIEMAIADGVAEAANRFNGRRVEPPPELAEDRAAEGPCELT